MKKPTPRRRRRQASPPPGDLRTYLATAAKEGLASGPVALVPVQSGLSLPAPSFGIGARVLKASKARYGRTRAFGPLWYAMAALGALYPAELPKHVNHSKLWRDVNERLARDPVFQATGYGTPSPVTGMQELSRQTVVRALKVLRAANR